MRILFVAPSYYPRVGGVEYVVKSIAERLSKRGHDVSVICGESDVDGPREEVVGGVTVTRWPTWSPGGAYHFPRLRSRLVEKLRELARSCDVVHLHSVHSVLTVLSLRALGGVGARKVLTPHYHGTGHTALRRAAWVLWRRYVRETVRYADLVHAVSSYEARLLERDFGVKPVVVEHGVEEWLLELEWRPSGYAMYSGRIERYKNVHRLASVVKALNELGYDLGLKIFGDGGYREKLRRHLERLGLDYELSPPQPYERYVDALSKADFLGLLSEREAFGQVVNEANAIGVPAVVAEPWGLSFKGRSRVLAVNLGRSDAEIAREVVSFLEAAQGQPRPRVQSWDQVVDLYTRLLYR